MKALGFGTLIALAATLLACGNSTPETSKNLTITGSVDTQTLALDNASAVAVGADGRTFSAYVKRSGKFTLDLPVGQVYRIIIANSTMLGELRPIGHMVNPTSRGTSALIAVKEGGTLALGTLRRAGTSSSGLHVTSKNCNCNASGGGSDEDNADEEDDENDSVSDDDVDETHESSGGGKDDFKCKQKDDDKERICGSEADVELTPDNPPGDACAAAPDEEGPEVRAVPCSSKDDNNDGKDDDDSVGSSDAQGGDNAQGGDDSGSESATPDGSSCGGSGCEPTPPKSCVCTKQCGTGSSCIASKCTPDAAPEGGSSPPR